MYESKRVPADIRQQGPVLTWAEDKNDVLRRTEYMVIMTEWIDFNMQDLSPYKKSISIYSKTIDFE